MGFSAIEFLVFLVLFGAQDNLGAPLGVPPAEEVQLMSDVAPEQCLFYASWATAVTPDPAGNASERWLAQPKIQAAWNKIRSGLFPANSSGDQFDNPADQALAELTTQLSQQALRRATAIFVERAEVLTELSGGCVIHLEPSAVEQVAAAIAALKKSLPAEWAAREFSIEESTYLAIRPPDAPVEISLGLRGQFAVIGFGPEAIAKIDRKVRTPEPAWLTAIKQQLTVQRRSSISRIDIKGWLALAEREPWFANAAPMINDILKLNSLVAFDSVCGLDERGFVSRHHLQIDGPTPQGLASLLDAGPLENSDWGALSTERDWTLGLHLSIDHALELIRPILELDGVSTWDEQMRQFEGIFGLKLEDDLLKHLDGKLFVQANFDSGDPTSGFLVQIGVGDEMSFFESYQTLCDKLIELADAGEMTKIQTEEIDGLQVYSLEAENGFGFMPKPVWCLAGGRVCIGFEQETVRKWLADKGPTLDRDEPFRQFQSQAGSLGLNNPITATRTDMARAIKLLMSFSSMLGMAGNVLPFDLADLPPVDVLTEGVTPSIAMTFRTEDGFEILSRQTIPSAAPGATAAAVGFLSAPRMFAIRAAAQQTDSKNRMRQILISLHNYHDAYTALPARFNRDKEGKPLLSWRVHILPFLEESDLYEQFHLDEPWDSPHNIQLVEKMPECYNHPKLKPEPGKTVYLGLAGKDTVWQDPADDRVSPKGIKLEKLAGLDGTSRTIALIEVPAEQAMIWSKPDDFPIDEAGFAAKLRAIWPTGLNVAAADASIWTLKADLSEDQWRGLFGISDGSDLDLNELRSR